MTLVSSPTHKFGSLPMIELGGLVEFRRGLTYKKSDEVEFSSTGVLRASNVDLANGQLDLTDIRYLSDDVDVPRARKLVPDSLLICTASGSRAHLGKMAHVSTALDFAFGGFMGLLVPKADVSARYLWYFSRSDAYRDYLEALAPGANINNLRFDDLARLEIPLPPLDEQKRIVAVLDQAFAALDRARVNAEENLASASQLGAAATEQLFPKDDKMAAGNSLDELCEAIVDCEHKTAPTQDRGIPSIRTPNVGKGVLLLDGVNRVSVETYREWTRRATPRPGDLILAREAPAGNVAVIPDGMRVCLGQRTVLLRPNKELFIPAYLAQLLLRPSSQARLLAHSRGATVQHINVKDIRAFRISSLPSIAEQRAVVRGVEGLMAQEQSLIDAYTRKLADIVALRQSLLQAAFSGQLT